jgi:hypothetical protein
MSDHPNEDLIELLYDADETEPAAAAVLEPDGPRVTVNTGHTDSAVESQLTLIATHMKWLADRTDVDVSRVADDALEIAEEMKASDDIFVDAQLYEEYIGGGE